MKRPFELLPLPKPSEFDPGEENPSYFHDNFASHFIEDMIGIMDTGLNIDLKAAESLRITVDKVLEDVTKKLNRNPLIKKYQESRAVTLQKKHKEKATKSLRTVDYYFKEYNPKDMVHRTWVVNNYLKNSGNKTHKEKWSIKELKSAQIWIKSPYIQAILDSKDISKYKHTLDGMKALAQYKLQLWNRPRYESANQAVSVPNFNPNSAVQKQELFDLLEITPLAATKKGNASWSREAIEELQNMSVDKDLLIVLQALIDFSFGAIIKSNFLKAFDTFTIDGILHGNLKLFGAKSFRLTSDSPNLLNMPSKGSIYAKPLKKCLVASKNRLIYTADLSALEDRVIANLSEDVNKLGLFLEGLDGHSLAATYYFKEQIENIIGDYSDFKEASRKLKALVDAKHEEADNIRQDGKPVSFGLAYGAFPPKIAQAIRCASEEAERVFNVYHNELYPGITKYREDYVLKTATKQGYIHLGLGCRMYCEDPRNEIRTIANATVQFWSILTLIAINELNHRIREAGLEDKMNVQATIYDSIYVDVDNDPEVIKWLNDNLIELMCVQYLEDEQIHNEAEGEISDSWTDMIPIKNNASIEEIQSALDEIKKRK